MPVISRHRSFARRAALFAEALESRQLLAAVSWDGGGDGVSWTSANNWSTNTIPTSADDVTIDIAANPTIGLTGTQSVNSLTLNEALNVSGTLTVNTATLSANLTLVGGSLSGGTYSGLPIKITSSGGTLNNVSVGGDILVDAANAYIELAGTTTFNTLRLTAANASVYLRNGYTLNNAITAEGAATGTRYVLLTSASTGTATVSPTGSIKLLAGTGGNLNIQNSSPGTLINNGLISAEAAGRTLTITNSVFSNNGTVRATGGAALQFTTQLGPVGTFTAGGTWQLTDGGSLSTSYAAQTLDINLAVSGAGNQLLGGLAGTSGLTRINNQIVFGPGAVLGLAAGGGTTATNGTVRIAGVIDLASDARFNVTGNVGFAGTGQPIIRGEISSATSMGRLAATGTVNLANPDGGIVRFDVDLTGAYDPPQGTRFDIVTSSGPILGDLGAYFGDSTPSGKLLLVGRDSALYAVVGTGTPPPAPSITGTVLEYETREAVVFTFNSNVSAFVSRNDVLLHNNTTGLDIPNTQARFTYDSTGATAALLVDDIPDGDYTLTIQANDISNSAGQTLTSPLTFNFYLLTGDADRNRIVNFNDLLILAKNYNLTGKTFSQGNFDYSSDGLVAFNDLLLLAKNYNKAVLMASLEPASLKDGPTRPRSSLAQDILTVD